MEKKKIALAREQKEDSRSRREAGFAFRGSRGSKGFQERTTKFGDNAKIGLRYNGKHS